MAGKDEIKQAVIDALNEHRSMDAETHALHHQFMAEYLAAREERRKRLNRIKDQTIASLALSTVGGFLYFIGQSIVSWIKALKGGG